MATVAEIKKEVDELVGFPVRVAIVPDGFSRNHFGPQVAVAGVLERKEDSRGQPHYRAMCDSDNFAYFQLDNVVLVNTLATVPTITLTIPVDIDEED